MHPPIKVKNDFLTSRLPFAFRYMSTPPPHFLCIFIIRPERVSVFGRDMVGVCVDVCAGGGGAEREVCWGYRVFSRGSSFSIGGSHISILPL